MRITAIRYRRLQSHEFGYGHDAVEAEAQIDEGEDAETALDELKAWVQNKLNKSELTRKLSTDLNDLANEVRSLEATRDRLLGEIKANRKIIVEHESLAALAREKGIDAGNLIDDGIPF